MLEPSRRVSSPKNRFLLWTALVLFIYSALTGCALGFWWLVGMYEYLSPPQYAVFQCSVYIGVICGAFGAVKLTTLKHENSSVIQFSCLPNLLGWFCICLSVSHPTCSTRILFAGRFLTGIVVGAILTSGSLYLMELAPSGYSGQFGSLVLLGITCGITVAQTLTYRQAWVYIIFANCILLCCIHCIFWLLWESDKQKPFQTSSTQCLLNGMNGKFQLNEASSNPVCCGLLRFCGLSSPLMSDTDRSRMHTIWALITLQQLTGAGSVVDFTGSMFHFGGPSWIVLYALVVGVPQMLCSALCILASLHVPRKTMLYSSAFMMSLSYLVLGVLLTSKEMKPISPFTTLLCVMCLVSYSLGWGPLPVVIIGELQTSLCPGFTLGSAVALGALVRLVSVMLFEPLCALLTASVSFWIWGLISLSTSLYVHRRLPETYVAADEAGPPTDKMLIEPVSFRDTPHLPRR